MTVNPAIPGQTGKSERTRQKLVEAGIELFSRDGYEATSTRAAEAHAGVQRNLISYHFGNKEAFWKACVGEVFGRVVGALQPALSQSKDVDPGERLRLLIRQFVRTSAANPEMMRIMFDEGRRDDWRLEWIVKRYARGFQRAIGQLFDEGVAHGVVPDLTAMQFYYILVSSGSIFAMAPESRLLFGEDACDDAKVDAQADAMVRLLTRQSGIREG